MSEEIEPSARAAELSSAPEFAPDLEARLGTYVEALLQANRSVNLVSRQDTAAHVGRFTAECLFLAKLLAADAARRPAPIRLLDIGSGGGFPGLIVKLALPGIEATLVEATQKKARFLADVCRQLDLRGTTILWARAEALSDRRSSSYRQDLRRRFDWVTAKAVGSLRESLDLAAPFLSPGGMHWSFKGPGVDREIAMCRQRFDQLQCSVASVEKIPGDQGSFVVAIRRGDVEDTDVSRETTGNE